ncbi:DUF1840 domain-containing protein [Thiomicrorhabdus hydrogeniphila]
MLMRFSVVSGPSIDMYEKQGLEMLQAMGLSGTVPSAMSPEDILPAIKKLESRLNANNTSDKNTNSGDYNNDSIDAKTRAFPLIELLKKAEKEQKSVMWEMV